MKLFLKIFAIVLASIVALVVGTYNLLDTSVGTRLATRVAERFLNANLKVGNLDFSLFSSYPIINVSLDSVEVRSNAIKPNDSLLFVKHLDAALNIKEFLDDNKLHLLNLHLDSTNAIAYINPDGKANFDIVQSTSEPDNDTTSSPLPTFFIDSLSISSLSLRFEDQRAQRLAQVHNLNLTLADSRYADSLRANLHLAATALYRDSSIAIKSLPVALRANAAIDTTFSHYDITNLSLSAADILATLQGQADILPNAYNLNIPHYSVSIPDIEKVRTSIPAPYDSLVSSFTSGGSLHSQGSIVGAYDSIHYPKIIGDLHLQKAWVQFIGKRDKINADLDSRFQIDANNPNDSYVFLDKFNVLTGKSYVQGKGAATRALGANPHVEASVSTRLDLNYISQVLPPINDLRYGGNLSGDASARFNLNDFSNIDSHLSSLQRTYLKANLHIGHIHARSRHYGFGIFGKNTTLEAGVNSMQSRRTNQQRFVISRLQMDTMAFHYQHLVKARSSQFNNSITIDKMDQGVPFLRGSLRFQGLKAFLFDTTAIVGNKANVSLTFRQDTIDTLLPILRANVRLDSVMYFAPHQAAMTDSLRFKLSIKPRVRKFRRDKTTGKRVLVDQSQRKPVGLDSLINLLQVVANAPEPADQALRTFQFEGSAASRLSRYSSPYFPLRTTLRRLDLRFTDDTVRLNNARVRVGRSSLNLDGELQNVRRYLRRGRTLTANLNVKGRRLNIKEILNGYYQGQERLKTSEELRKAERLGLIQPRKISGDRLIRPQVFERGFQQKVEERRKAMRRDPKFLQRQMWLDSIKDLVAQNEAADSIAAASDQDNIQADAIDSSATFSLFCLPSNLNVNFTSKIDTVRFANLILNNFTGNVDMKNSTLHLHNVAAQTNIGDLAANAMYHCDGDGKNADIGLDVQGAGVDITNLVNTLPQLDSLVPMLRSFQGVVAIDLSALAQVDSIYNLDLAHLQAATHISGDNLVLLDGETFAEIAKLLLFKKKTKNVIDNISVELLVNNNEMQVLPFMVAMDKYQVAVGGENTLDMRFKYHISVLESPVPIKFGVNVSGTLDDMDIGVGKARYKDKNTITRKGQLSSHGVNVRTELQNRLKEAIKNSIESYAVEKP